MSYDYYHNLNYKKIDELLKEPDQTPYAKSKIFSLFFAKALNKNMQKEIRNKWINENKEGNFSLSYVMPDSEIQNALNILPTYSAYLHLTFQLAKPYISKDDEIFYITENPIRKDKVSREPMVSGSTWKGNLRWTAQKILELALRNGKIANEDALKYRLILFRLFGNEKDIEKEYLDGLMPGVVEKFQERIKPYLKGGEGFEGRLRFFPTYFQQVDLEVINPHKREHRAGTKPIYYEVVPGAKKQGSNPGAQGVFQILYIPYDLIGRDEKIIENEVKEDWEILSETICGMMIEFGFGAKKLTGQGIAQSKIVDGAFQIKNKPKILLKDISFSELKKRVC